MTGAPVDDGAFESAPRGHRALAAGVDDAGEQGHDPRADLDAGAQTELVQDHPGGRFFFLSYLSGSEYP